LLEAGSVVAVSAEHFPRGTHQIGTGLFGL